MDPKECTYCDRVFATTYNRKRHQKLKHPSKSLKRQKEEESSQSSDSNSSTASQQSETGLEDFDAWDTIIKETCDELPDLNDSIQTTEQLLKEPHINVFLDALYNQLTERLQFSHHMESENELYTKLQQTTKKYLDSKEGYDKSEAFKKAWQERKLLIIDMLLEHEETITKMYLRATATAAATTTVPLHRHY